MVESKGRFQTFPICLLSKTLHVIAVLVLNGKRYNTVIVQSKTAEITSFIAAILIKL